MRPSALELDDRLPIGAQLGRIARNVMYTVDDPKKPAVGFKLSEGMEVLAEFATPFKFASQKSKLAGTIRGSYFAFKSDH